MAEYGKGVWTPLRFLDRWIEDELAEDAELEEWPREARREDP